MALLRLLLARGALTTQDLAAALPAAPQAVPALIEEARALGVPIRSAGAAGADAAWELAAPVDLLDAGALRAALGDMPLLLEVRDACASTNAELMAQPQLPGGTVLACEYQSAGRGRRGRGWHTGIGGALTFSLLWRFGCAPAALSGLSLAVAVMVARGLAALGCRGVQVKWPNDLLHGGAKLAGILIELPARAAVAGTDAGAEGAAAPRRDTPCVIGIGLNVRLPAGVAQAIDRPVTDLAAACTGAPPGRTAALAVLLGELATGLAAFERAGFAAFRDDWLACHAHAGHAVSIELDGRSVLQGVAEGVDAGGALLVRAADGVHAVHSGEVSLRIK